MLITIYIIRYILCALAMGTLMVRCNVFSCMKKRTGFLLGVAVAPFCIAVIVYIVCLIMPGISSKVLIVFPMLASVLYLLMGKSRQVLKSQAKAAASRMKTIGRAAMQHKVCFVIPVIAAVIFGIIMILADENYFVYTGLKTMSIKKYAFCITIALALAVMLFCILAYFVQKGKFKHIRFNEGMLAKMALGTGLLLMVIITGTKIYYRFQTNLSSSDPSHYYAQAKYFSESRDAGEIDDYSGEKEGTVFKDDHGYLWPVWLGDGRFFTTAQEDSLNPVIDKIAICIVLFSFLLALAAIVWEATGSGLLAGFAISLISLYRHLESQILEGSRDAFRFLGMLLLLAVCVNSITAAYRKRSEAESGKRKFQKQDILDILFMGLFSYFCIEGHEGNIYLMLGLFIVYGISLIVCKISFLKLCLLGLSAGIGTVLGITKAIGNFIASGNFASSTAVVFHDTKVLDALRTISSGRDDWGKIAGTYYAPELILISLGILSMLFLLVEGIRHRKEKGNIKILSMAVCLLGLLLPMLGVFDFLGYEFSKWTIEQSRYRMYFMVLFSIAVCYTGHVLWNKKASVIARYCMLFFIVLVTGLAPLSQAGIGPVTGREAESRKNAVSGYSRAGASVREKVLESEREVYVDDQILAYYCDCDAKLLYHPIAEPLIQAKTEEEIKNALARLNIGFIILDVDNMYHDYSLLPLWDYINDPQYADAFAAQTETGKKWVLYQIKE